MRAPRATTIFHSSLILLVLASGCAKRTFDQIQPGITTESQLKASVGLPKATWTPSIRTEARLHDYEDGCSYQIERGIVISVACPPVGPETTLQHWRQRWVGHTQKFEALPDSANSHGQKRYQFASKQAGMAVIYDEATERVVRVVKYGGR